MLRTFSDAHVVFLDIPVNCQRQCTEPRSTPNLPSRRAAASLLEVEPRSAAARLRISYDASLRGFLGNALGWQLAAHARHSGEQCGWQH